MIFKENLTEILDGIRPFLLPLNSYYTTNSSLKFDIKAKQFYAASQRVL